MASKRPTKKGKQRSTKPRSSNQTIKKQEGVSTPVKVILIGAAVLMALSTVLSALSGLVSRNNSDTTISSVEDIDAMYQASVEELEADLADDPDNTEKLNSVGNSYMSWAQMTSLFAQNDEGTLHANSLYEKALSYFDHSLEIEDSAETRTARALCLMYEGEGAAAASAMAETVEKFPDDAGAWANYGMVLESRGEEEQAREAYATAIELDPNDDKGAKTYAEGRLESMDTAAQAQQIDTPNGTGAQALTQTLEEQTGTGL